MSKNFFLAVFLLTSASFFWSGNFFAGKIAYLSDLTPFKLGFFRWLLAMLILLPFTYNEIISHKKVILKNLPILFFLALTSVGLFNSFTYLSLVYTQVINASLFNTAIPAIIILLCILFQIEKTNKYQIVGLVISVLGILFIKAHIQLNNKNIILHLRFTS